MALLTITPKDPWQDFVLPILAILGPAAWEVSVPKGAIPARGHSKVPLNYKLWLITGSYGLCVQPPAGEKRSHHHQPEESESYL